MGSRHSQEDYDRFALEFYEFAVQHPCLLPDISIDESLLKYSGADSNAVLQTYSNDLVDSVPAYIDSLGSSLAPFTSIPNAVGLGALVISMIIEICIKSATQTSDDSYSMLRRVFGEEKASAVRDTMSEYLKRHHRFMNNDQRLREELHRLEQQLSNHLTTLRNSLLHDGQMSTRGLKIWVNGASFHLQMLIHEARLNIQAGKPASDYVISIKAVNNFYLQDLHALLEKYKTYDGAIKMYRWSTCGKECSTYCIVEGDNCKFEQDLSGRVNPCQGSKLITAFMNQLVSNYGPITSLRTHFLNIMYNVDTLVNQHGSFNLPSRI